MSQLRLQKNTKVFLRLDLDLPNINGVITDTYRLDKALPTLEMLKNTKCRITIAGHIGRPHGPERKYSTTTLKPYFDNFFGGYEYTLLENLRFDTREESGSDEYAHILAADNDIYVNESFATSHRPHTSITYIPKILPGYAGLRFEEEVRTVNKLLNNPKRPLVALVGGAKIESKKPLIDKFQKLCDEILIGGKLGLGWKENLPKNVHLPLDYAQDNKDIGTKTIESYRKILDTAKTIIWAGPMGLYEDARFEAGTKNIAQILAKHSAEKIVGGGDTADAIRKFHLEDNFDFISTGGSALLEFIVGGTLPGIEVLK